MKTRIIVANNSFWGSLIMAKLMDGYHAWFWTILSVFWLVYYFYLTINKS